MARTVIPSWAVRVLIRRYIVSGMSKVVLMAYSISHHTLTLQYGFIDLCMIQSVRSCRAVYEKFKDGTVKDISEELPFEVPNGWAWVRLESLGFYHGGHTPSMSEPSFWGGNILWVSAKDMKCDVIIDTQDKITHKGAAALQMVNADSLVLVTRSGILKHTFPVAIVKTPCTINQDLKAFVPYCTEVTQYLALCLRALQAVILKRYRKKGMTVQSIIWESFIRMPIPLPPLVEQKRIVAKIEKLMPLAVLFDKRHQFLDLAHYPHLFVCWGNRYQ